MNSLKFETPPELRSMAEKAIDQAEKAFEAFFGVASASMASFMYPGADISKKALFLLERNMRDGFDAARKVALATDLQEAMKIQTEFLSGQFMNAREQMRQIAEGAMSAGKI